jgi:hypothetical protein
VKASKKSSKKEELTNEQVVEDVKEASEAVASEEGVEGKGE